MDSLLTEESVHVKGFCQCQNYFYDFESYQCLKEFSDFGPHQEISYEFSADSLFVLKRFLLMPEKCLILNPSRKSPMNSVLIVFLC